MRLPHMPFEFEPEQVHEHNLMVISIRNESLTRVFLTTAPAQPFEMQPHPDDVSEGATFRAPVKQRDPTRRNGGREWLPCWFGGLSQADKDEA